MNLGSVIHRGCLTVHTKVSPEKSPTLSVYMWLNGVCVCHSWWKLIGGVGCFGCNCTSVYSTVLGLHLVNTNLHKPATCTSLDNMQIDAPPPPTKGRESMPPLQKVGNRWSPYRMYRIDGAPTEGRESMQPLQKVGNRWSPYRMYRIDGAPTEGRELMASPQKLYLLKGRLRFSTFWRGAIDSLPSVGSSLIPCLLSFFGGPVFASTFCTGGIDSLPSVEAAPILYLLYGRHRFSTFCRGGTDSLPSVGAASILYLL